jgi:endonuclease-3
MMSTFDKIWSRLKKKYPHPRVALKAADPWQLLAATILSAQCTDARVNSVTPGLFKKFPTVKHFARAKRGYLEAAIHSTGFFRNKAKNLMGAARRVVEAFDGRVPRTMEELTTLPGVARKTANVVLSGAFGKNEGIAVDTHVGRVSRRLGLTRQGDPVKVEADLMKMCPRRAWGDLSLRLIFHGRATCHAKRPRCSLCILKDLCPSFLPKASEGRVKDTIHGASKKDL